MHADAFTSLFGFAAAALQLVIVAGVVLRVILTRHPPGSSFAWILITTVLPYVGFALYLMFGERPLGRLRARPLKKLLRQWLRQQARNPLVPLGPWPRNIAFGRNFIDLCTRLGGLPLATGSCVSLKPSAQASLDGIYEDVCRAKRSIDMAFYIFDPCGSAARIKDALIAAAGRGVRVRLLVDDFGSRNFLRSQARQEMQDAGIEIASAMPMRFLRFFGLQRADLRLHRKTVIIDDEIGYTGSFNLIDPDGYDASSIVGAWVDAMVRITGPAVLSLKRVWVYDWALQPDNDLSDFQMQLDNWSIPNTGKAATVCVPTGPYSEIDRSVHMVLAAINNAQSELTIVTPYFVPNEAIASALINAALRGIRVRLIAPEQADSPLVNWAMRRYYDDLLTVGAEIYLYQQGLLHTKSIAVDSEFAVFGTLNLDNRSMHLNFELMMVIFEPNFMSELDALNQSYIASSRRLRLHERLHRPLADRLKEGVCHLLSPLL